MAHFRSLRLPAVLVAGVAASALVATPALATEGPAAAPPPPSLPAGVVPPTIAPTPFAGLPAQSPRVIRNARLVRKRVKQGRRATLRVSLTTPSRVRIVLTRSNGRKVHTINVPARGQVFAVRLPARVNGHRLNLGRYRVSVVAIDGNGVSSAPFKRTLTVRR